MLTLHHHDVFLSILKSSAHYPAAVFQQDLQPIFQLLFSICPSVRPRRPSGSGQDHFTRDTGSRVSLLQWIFNQTLRSHWTNYFLFLTVGWELELHAAAEAAEAEAAAGGCREPGTGPPSSPPPPPPFDPQVIHYHLDLYHEFTWLFKCILCFLQKYL